MTTTMTTLFKSHFPGHPR